MSNIKFKKSGDWTAFGGPSYGAVVDGVRSGAIQGEYVWTGGGCRSQGRKTKHYRVCLYVPGGVKTVGTSFSLSGAQEIVRRAVASVGYRAVRQPNGQFSVFNRDGVKQFESDSFIAVTSKYPAVLANS
jgi:hypothetical protein